MSRLEAGAGRAMVATMIAGIRIARRRIGFPEIPLDFSLGPVRCGLALSGSGLRFAADFGPGARTVPAARPGGFFEGLWEADVAEFFFAPTGATGDGAYLEINLAPNGAWWASWFSAPRVRDLGCPLPTVRSSGDGQRAEAWIDPRDLRALVLSSPRSTGNLTAISGGQFFSHAPLGGRQPDFHRPADFLPLITPPDEA
ncbi:hypothetical protein BH23VER1_BH23VER1_36460 [soil metagenome]